MSQAGFSTGFLGLRISDAVLVAPGIRMLTFVAADGRPLPPHEPGAHIDLLLPLSRGGQIRSYSLLDPGADRLRYRIAVRRDLASRGGSRWLHEVAAVGDVLEAAAPRGHFPLAAGATGHRLIAGGIGITAILSLAAALAEVRVPVTLDWTARGVFPFRAALAQLLPGRVRLHDSAAGQRLDLDAALAAPRAGEVAYVCGPRRMIGAARAAATRQGWPDGALRVELFGPPESGDDQPFTVRLARSGGGFTVPAGTSLLEALETAGLDPLFGCRRGECGLCAVKVEAGALLHRDVFLGEAERAEGTRMCACVSRAEGEVVLAL
jgi:vanillate O-demethylase ferredoxin subunit